MTGSGRNATWRKGSASVTPSCLRRLAERVERLAHFLEGQIAHQARDGQRQFGQHLAVGDHHETALQIVQPIDGGRHVRIVGADDADVVAVVPN